MQSFGVMSALYPLHMFHRHLLDLLEQVYSIEVAIMRVIEGRSVSTIALLSSVPRPCVSHLYLSLGILIALPDAWIIRSKDGWVREGGNWLVSCLRSVEGLRSG